MTRPPIIDLPHVEDDDTGHSRFHAPSIAVALAMLLMIGGVVLALIWSAMKWMF